MLKAGDISYGQWQTAKTFDMFYYCSALWSIHFSHIRWCSIKCSRQ